MIALGTILTWLGGLYALLAFTAICWRARRTPYSHAAQPPITVLKPLCGNEPGLYEHLYSFCKQDYPRFQVVFGLRDAADGALPVVRRLQKECSDVDTALVIDPTLHGTNRKVSNLINMLPHARFEHLVVADSDIIVPAQYLSRVIAPLTDPRNGLVTCAYYARAAAGFVTGLGAAFINDWFMPSVFVAALFGSQAFVSGATIALRREVLNAIGGFAALANQLADDFKLGERIRRHGLRVVLSQLRVETTVDEPSLAALCQRELRWLRTIQSIAPLGYAGYFVTFSLPLALLGTALCGFNRASLWLLGVTAAARLAVHALGIRHALGSRREDVRQRVACLLLLPLHDLLLVGLWCWSFRRREVVWRHERFGVEQDGSLRRIG